ncbi:MAG: GTPase Era [Firmicutes bacterium]|nr:GTPase Era [Bacillota bacterium]
MKSGFVSIVGRPNVGKSTLLNSLLERKIAITSNVSGTTRNIIQGIYNDDDSQIVFIDTPGIHKPQNKLGTYLNQKAYMMTEDVDLLLFLVDVEKGFGKGDQFILEKIKQENKPTFLILNKVDRIKKEELFEIITELNKLHDFKEIIPVSALKGDNVVDLINTIKKYLNDDVKYYDDEIITNVSRNFLIAEFVREKILHLTNKEVPHTVNCMVESYEDTGNIIEISVLIIVDRDNLKKIIIGKQGRMLKEIGIQARQDIEEFLGKQVFLETHVKTIEDWRDKDKYLIEFGLKEID